MKFNSVFSTVLVVLMASQSAWADEYQLFSSEIFKVTEWPEGFPGGYKEDTSDRSKGYSRIQKWQNNYQDRVDAPERNFSIKDPHYARYQAYHQTMGTQLIPLKWFAALETTMVENLEDRKTLADPAVYENYGFIQSDVPSAYLPKVNGVPLELPIGFAISEDPKADAKFGGIQTTKFKKQGVGTEKIEFDIGGRQWLGLNCAGCHTTQMSILGQKVIVDGNATMFKLNQFEYDMATIIEQTLTSKENYTRFRNRVMAFDFNSEKENPKAFSLNDPEWKSSDQDYQREPLYKALSQYAKDFKTFLANNHTHPDGTLVDFSPGSVDALTLGGNMAAGCNRAMWENPKEKWDNLIDKLSRGRVKKANKDHYFEDGNCQVANVPVNIPHIWATNNFDGGHYAGEETNVTGRNFGAAMTGFGATRLTIAPQINFDTSNNPDFNWFGNRFEIDQEKSFIPETSVKLKDLDANQKWYDTLKAPTWQGLVEAGIVDPVSEEEQQQALKGQEIYQDKCASCHGQYKGDVYAGGMLKIATTEPNVRGAEFWDLVRVPTHLKVPGHEEPVNVIGTDLARNNRDGIESNKKLPKTLVESFNQVFAADPTFEQINPDGDRTIAARFYRQFWVLATLKTQLSREEEQKKAFVDSSLNGVDMLMGCRDINELRRNIVLADAYKARPLDGIAFTGPFLHNGSVPTLWDLFSPSVAENEHGAMRPKEFEVGCRNYDVSKMGFVCDSSSSDKALSKGAEPFDITAYGQSNQGHEDDSKLDPDVYGATASFGTNLSAEEKMQLISFLKTLETPENPERGSACELYTYHH